MTNEEKKADDLAREVYEDVYQARHTPIVIDVYGSGRDMILAYADEIRRECAESAKQYIQQLGDQSRASEVISKGVYAAIRGKEVEV